MNRMEYARLCELLPRDPADRYEASADVIGECEGCGEAVTAADEPFTDGEGNLFCCMDCAMEYNGIRKAKKEDVYRFRERRAAV